RAARTAGLAGRTKGHAGRDGGYRRLLASTVLPARRRPERDPGQPRARQRATGPQVRLDVAGTAGRVRATEGIVRAPSTNPPAAGPDPLPDHAVPRAHP